ncbi:MAG: hypothetical protein AB7K86_15500 [Rhodospirillales bacterium]
MRPEELGALIQAYVKEKARVTSDEEASPSKAAAALDPKLRSRIDALGFDGELLLRVAPAEVLGRIESLEAQAQREDARAAAAAHRHVSVEASHPGPFRARPAGTGQGKRPPGRPPGRRGRSR